MGALFGKSKKVTSRVTEQDKAVLQLKQQRDKLKNYQKKIELNLEKDRQLAKRLLNEGKKERAKLLLRKKKYQEQLLQNTDNQLEQLERLVHDIEYAQIEIQVIDGLKSGNTALKKVHEVLNIDEIESILEESKEGIEKQREIDEMLSGALTEEDEAAVEQELEDIINADAEVSLPEVPSDKLPEPEKEAKPEKDRTKEKQQKVMVAA